MQLDKFSDYALRMLIALATRAPDRMSTQAIAKLYGLSEHHLSKIAAALVHGGFVTSERGRGGGLSLAMPAEAVNVGSVLRHLRGDTPVAECFGENKTCRLLPQCGLRDPLRDAQEAFFAVLDQYSLAGVMGSPSAMKQLLADTA